jgi:hypothetical protein
VLSCGLQSMSIQAFLVPVVELLSKVKWAGRNGTGAVIISPTRELALQIYGVVRDLCEEGAHPLTHGLVIGTSPSSSSCRVGSKLVDAHRRACPLRGLDTPLAAQIQLVSILSELLTPIPPHETYQWPCGCLCGMGRWGQSSCGGRSSRQGREHPRVHPGQAARPPAGVLGQQALLIILIDVSFH